MPKLFKPKLGEYCFRILYILGKWDYYKSAKIGDVKDYFKSEKIKFPYTYSSYYKTKSSLKKVR